MSELGFLGKLLDGAEVEWKPLSDTVKISRGKRLVKSQLEKTGRYAVFQNSLKPLGYYHEANVPSDSTFIICAGSAGEIGYSQEEFWAADDVYFLAPPTGVSSRYLYHWLLTQQRLIFSQVRKGAVPRLPKPVVEALCLPIPCPEEPKKSLAIQNEIVRILDSLAELTADLAVELAAELSARKKQYNHYRNRLLTFKDGEVEWKALGDIAILRRGRVMSKGYLRENAGEYPVYSSQTANGGMIGRIQTYDFEGEYVSWTTDGANAGTVFYQLGRFSITNVCGVIASNQSVPLNLKFLFHWLSIAAKEHVTSGMGNPKLMSHQVAKIPVPIPFPDDPERSLAEQARIASILDTFDTLATSLSEGLPREIALRQQQYEYYRDRLLSFPKPVEAVEA